MGGGGAPLLLSRTKLASKPKKLVEKHRVSIVFANGGGGGLRPPQPPRSFFLKPCRACFKAQEVFASGGAAPPPPQTPPPRFF